MRTTKAELHALADKINSYRAQLGLSGNYVVRYAYDRPRLEKLQNSDETGGSANISPRLPPGELAQWMHAYVDGMDAARRELVGEF